MSSGAACPICKRAVALRSAGNRSYPFCTERCRTIDLGSWLAENYRVPDPAAALGDEEIAQIEAALASKDPDAN